MPSLMALLRSLGNDGAVQNVRTALDARQREDWLVASLTHRLAVHDLTEVVVGPPAAAASVGLDQLHRSG